MTARDDEPTKNNGQDLENAESGTTGDDGVTGVQALLDKLHREGVEAGRDEAQRLIDEAKAEKQRILDAANAEAKQRKDEARREIADMKRAAHDALEQAARDSVLELRQRVLAQFSEDVRQLISAEVREHDIVRQIVLAVARRAGETLDDLGVERITVELPAHAPEADALRRAPADAERDDLMRLVLGVTGERLRAGLVLREGDGARGGIRVIDTENGLELDLTEDALADIMLDHLQPRFRALLDGTTR